MSTPPSSPATATGSQVPTPPRTPVISTPHPTLTQLDYSLRHGIDPIPQPTPGQEESIEYKNIVKLHETYQRMKLKGFTISKLQEAGCFGGDHLLPINLPAQIHPFWSLERWRPSLAEDISHGYSGKWDVKGNKMVNDAVLPVLYLATMILSRVVTWSWWDALMLGDRRRVPLEDCKNGCPPSNNMAYEAYSFHLRRNTMGTDANAVPNSHLRVFTSKIVLRIASRVAYNLQNSIDKDFGLAYGWYTTARTPRSRPDEYPGGSITISSEMVLPLLRDDLSVSERLLQQFLVAKTLCHESMHAFGAYIRTTIPGIPARGPEPLFEDEIMSELGRSWENSTFGGSVDHLHQRDSSKFHDLSLGSIVSEWPGWVAFGDGDFEKQGKTGKIRFRKHETVIDGQFDFYWPLHMAFVESLQHSSYWHHEVVKYGSTALVAPRIFGLRIEKGKPGIAYITDRVVWKWRIAKGVVLTPAQNATQEARALGILEAQARADYLRTELRLQDEARKARRLGRVTQLDQRELDFHVKTLGDSITKRANPTAAGDDVMAYEILGALRSSKYSLIRCQANLALGLDHMSGDARRRYSFIERALEEATPLATADPNDAVFARVIMMEMLQG
ncbi:uncharacterized protein PAC_18726 [Phialocephala subalpina]|uniref:Uncharacterized protein n=1 Tax=Phialocephala subalpina TaxID=576137 RepID=A0A1L7XUX7_9HELO|nr:uncharacterized protein PAC_18726 [Phialocephala subalpina]